MLNLIIIVNACFSLQLLSQWRELLQSVLFPIAAASWGVWNRNVHLKIFFCRCYQFMTFKIAEQKQKETKNLGKMFLHLNNKFDDKGKYTLL